MGAGQAPRGEPQPPENLLADRCLLGSPLGRGAFGTTYLAEDRLLSQPVVIKLLNAEDRDAISLFRQEARITASLAHPNIVKILDSAISTDGRPYLVTEWVDGKDLRAILDADGRLGTYRSQQVAEGIAEALAYIHGRGFVHRDLKPSNVLIPGWPSAADYRNARILDFGVAGQLRGGLTRAGMVFGTPRYMAPEQILGQPQSPATDVYGLGLLFWRCWPAAHCGAGPNSRRSCFAPFWKESPRSASLSPYRRIARV